MDGAAFVDTTCTGEEEQEGDYMLYKGTLVVVFFSFTVVVVDNLGVVCLK